VGVYKDVYKHWREATRGGHIKGLGKTCTMVDKQEDY
jgi:hypothetical protein